MEPLRCIGSCLPVFLAAVFFDLLGLILLFLGIFANLRIDGRFYGDFFIYSGSLLVFTSLACWLMWYMGNVRVVEEDGLKKRSSIVELARKLSERLSQKLKGEEGVKCVDDAEEEEEGGQVGPSPVRKASKVTRDKSTAYINEGYDDNMESPDEEKKDVDTCDTTSIST